MALIHDIPALPARPSDANKGSFGRILVLGGCRGMAGAPCLAARAACRSGAGLVCVAVPAGIWDIVAVKLDECLTLGLPEARSSGSFGRKAWKALREHLAWPDVVALGPGMSQAAQSVALAQRVIGVYGGPLVLDADALNAVALAKGRLKSLREAQARFPKRQVVLTPHPGEMARLIGGTARDVQADRPGASFKAAQASGAIVVLKGAGTLVCDGQRIFENRTGNPGMASGGSGDVLTGMIAAMIGQHMGAFDAACLGVHLHGLAGDLGAARLGQWSLVAGDLIDELPRAFRKHAGLA